MTLFRPCYPVALLILAVGAAGYGTSFGYGYGSVANTCVSTQATPNVIRVTSSYLETLPSGFFADFLSALQAKAGVYFKFSPRLNVSSGTRSPNGTWDPSLILMLLNNETDLIGPDIVALATRAEAADFLNPIFAARLQVLYNTQFGLNGDTLYYYVRPTQLGFVCSSTNSTAQAACASMTSRGAEAQLASDAAGLAKVLTGNFGFIGGSTYFDTIVPNQGGKVQAQAILVQFAGLAVQKGSPLRDLLNPSLLEMAENGDVQEIFEKYGIRST